MINRIVAPLFAAGLSLAAFAQELPQPSPLGVVEQTVGLTKVKVTYSRPSMKGRVIFGGLVPYDQVWRTGANKATRVEISDRVMVQGKELPAGTYALFTMPGKETWTIMFNKDAEQSGTSKYDPAMNVLELTLPVAKCEPTETFTIDLGNLSMESADLELRWERTLIRIPIKVDPTKQAVANIDAALKEGKVDAAGFNRMARYCVERGIRIKEAFDWAQTSVKMERHYWNLYTLALTQEALADHKGAIATAKEAQGMAEKENDQSTKAQIEAKLKEWEGGK